MTIRTFSLFIHSSVPSADTTSLRNKLFHARNDYREDDDKKAENEKAEQPWQKR
jgi:hypothetical protein